MPTGYTAVIADGISFKDFVMQCARAVGACVEMRDESMNAKIPEEFIASNHHLKELGKAKAKLAKLQVMSIEKAAATAQKEYKKSLDKHASAIKEKLALQKQYQTMLMMVANWKPPSSDHERFKDFMRERLQESIKFDCDTKYYDEHKPKLLSPQAWLKVVINDAQYDIEYHTKGHQEECARVQKSNLWLKQLRDSLYKEA